MWTAQAPVFSDAYETAQAKRQSIQQEYNELCDKLTRLTDAQEQAIAACVNRAQQRQSIKYADKRSTLDTARAVAEEAYQQVYRAYVAATSAVQDFDRQQRHVLRRVSYRARYRITPFYQDILATVNREMQAAQDALATADKSVRALRYPKGIQLASYDNNYGEAVVSPAGDVWMVPCREDHGNVYEAVKSTCRSRGKWLRVFHGGLTDFTDDRSNVYSFTARQMDALLDFADMLRTAAEQDANYHDNYTRWAQRLTDQINSTPPDM